MSPRVTARFFAACVPLGCGSGSSRGDGAPAHADGHSGDAGATLDDAATSGTGGASGAGHRADSGTAPGDAGPHEYFDALVARPDHRISYSMRSQTELDQYSDNGSSTSVHVRYQPDADTYWDKQDAAKVLIPAGELNLDQVRFPIKVSSGENWVIWDAYWGSEFQTERGDIDVNKTFMVSTNCLSAETVFMEINVSYSLAKLPEIGRFGGRHYANCGSPGPNVTSTLPLEPRLVAFDLVANRWYRIIQKYEYGPEWMLFSEWIIGEDLDALQVYDNLQLTNPPSMKSFWLEYNTSQTCDGCGDRIGYVRNLVVLQNPTETASLFQRPLRG